jgi:threonine aldolase
MERCFASDNWAGVHPAVVQALMDANRGHADAYGRDPHTLEAVAGFKAHFGAHCEVYLVFNGTAANVLGLQAVTRSYHAVICAQSAHIHNDECGAPEKFSGCKLLTVPSGDGKLTVAGIKRHLQGVGVAHHAQPRAVSITQSTELGTVYRPEEILDISDFAHRNDLILHVDGARLANAAAHLGADLKTLTTDAGVDLVSFGGTKNGLMFGEAVVFCRGRLAVDFQYIRKQGMQLASKMRFAAAQFSALLNDDLWLRNARHANAMAAHLARGIAAVPGVTITQPVESNAVFALLPPDVIPRLQEKSFFHVWNPERSEVRLMTSWDTTPGDIDTFLGHLDETMRRVATQPGSPGR